MKSLPLYDEDLSGLSADEISDEIDELRLLKASPGWKILQRLFAARYAAHRDALVDAYPHDDRATLALAQGRAQILREIAGDARFDDDDVSNLLNQMIKARQEAYRESGDQQAKIEARMEANPGLSYAEAMDTIYPGERDFDGSGASLYTTEAGVGHVVGNDSIPGSERGGRLAV